jgi:perosamine synthetase
MVNTNIPWAIPNIQKEDTEAVKNVLRSGWLSMGREVKRFEDNMTSYLNIRFGVATNNGTSALDLALKCLGISTGDEVIIPALTYIATGNAVLYNNGTPVFVDIDDTVNIDTTRIEGKITERTKAIINIDLGGNVSDYTGLLRISKQYDIPLVVDGAQSLGSEHHGIKCCTHGLLNTTSFHAAKILTTIEGGMVFTKDKNMFVRAQAIRNQGDVSKFDHRYLGNNYRMIDLVAAIGNAQIPRIEKTLTMRREKARYYRDGLKYVDFPNELPNTVNSHFLFLILAERRNSLNAYLHSNGIDTRITYPKPINEQPLFRTFSKETYPIAKKMSQHIISLPLFHSITRNQQDYIIKKINTFTR